MKPLILDVLFHDDETKKLEELGLKENDDLSKYPLGRMIFYNIEAISPCMENGKEDEKYSLLHVNGTTFITPIPFDELASMIS